MAQQYRTTSQSENEMAGTLETENNALHAREKNALLYDPHSKCTCYKKWSSTQFFLFCGLIVLLVAVTVGILSNIDRIIGTDDSSSNITADYCVLGVFEPPDDYTTPTLPDSDWTWSYADNTLNGPGIWSTYYPQCGCDIHQSPRDIDTVQSRLNTPRQLCGDVGSLLKWEIDDNYTDEYNGTFEVFHTAHTGHFSYISDFQNFIHIFLKILWLKIDNFFEQNIV